ncbi:M56 family metallopeptidase [Proteiniborus sp.]|uniref:M56 family metallopeptidase n=1 Tax=Proteiniborus sp. TaxID=2079015 RepID=UPI00331A7C3A
MNDVFKLILSLSLSGTILSLILLLIKPLIENRISKAVQYYIWIVVLLRLILPFSFEESLMNKFFYMNNTQAIVSTNQEIHIPNNGASPIINTSIASDAKEKLESKSYDYNSNSRSYFSSLFNSFNNYVFYIYLIGVIIAIATNIVNYLKFLRKLQNSYKNTGYQENLLLSSLASEKSKVALLRSSLINTPMLVGIFSPKIVIPDINYNKNQLKNILSHELIHLKRFDIGLKWLTMIITSIHWFNPIMILIRKEINNICELSCDEAIIKNLSDEEKQEYGDTLIFSVAQYKYPPSQLQVTMCAEKRTLKKRLLAIMNYNKKSRLTVLTSVLLLTMIILSSLYLGACTINTLKKPPQVIITNESDYAQNIYTVLKNKWNGEEPTEHSFYEFAKKNNLLRDLHFLTADEKFRVDFGKSKPDSVSVKVALFSDIQSESPLKIVDVPVHNNRRGVYEFNNPYDIDDNELGAKGKIFSVSATWGNNSCEYIFAAETPSHFSISTKPAGYGMNKFNKLQAEADKGNRPDLLDAEAVALEFINSNELTEYLKIRAIEGVNKNPISISHFNDYTIVKYGLKKQYGYIELKLIQPRKSNDNNIWMVDLFNIKMMTYSD